ncbi:hypothetical protein LWM68_14260 [Niabella sp. W65]|nr:hypothetical protein [Niabella sp. W65]MCH7363810.1 hypothetical protein [Niabella sp. W65]
MMLKDAKHKKLKLGKDLGILSHNDEIVRRLYLTASPPILPVLKPWQKKLLNLFFIVKRYRK